MKRHVPALLAVTALLAGCPALNLLGLGNATITGTVKAELTNGVAFLGPGDSYRTLNFTSELPVPAATVTVTDTTGAQVGVASASTDASGNFTLSNVPGGKTLVIVATKGATGSAAAGTVTVEALWAGGSTRDLDTVTTMVADKVLHESSLSASQISQVSQAKIDALETALDGAVGDTSTIPDLTNPSDVTAKFDAAASSSTAVASAFAALSQ